MEIVLPNVRAENLLETTYIRTLVHAYHLPLQTRKPRANGYHFAMSYSRFTSAATTGPPTRPGVILFIT